ncbi:MAG: anhydro-N-acetylmuramic acid kinase [Alphaproteobacteria bacterium]
METDGEAIVRPVDFRPYPYDAHVRDKVRACFGKRVPDEQTREAEKLVTDLHIEAVQASGFQADIIGFHGQTITHDPVNALTWQLGDGAALARASGMDVICDFRQADIRAGGQGAPLIPLYHAALLIEHDKPAAILNLGGVANVTYVTANGDILAFDTGPANAMMDDFIRLRTGAPFDAGGETAARGKPDSATLKAFLSHPYFERPAPKSLDRNEWSADMVSHLSTEDGMATLMAMVSASLEKAFEEALPEKPQHVYACGGGRKNTVLMDMLGKSRTVRPIEDLGRNGDAIEAEGFAYLAVRSKRGLPLTLPSTTGVRAPQTGGVFHLCA